MTAGPVQPPSAPLLLLPDLGDLLRLQPHYNAATVTEWLTELRPQAVWWASGPDPEHPLRDALPAAGFAVQELDAPDWAWADEEHGQLLEFLKLYPQGRERLAQAARAEAEFRQQLSAPLTPESVVGTLREAAQSYHAATRAALDEGPGTRWRERRLDDLAGRLKGCAGAAIVALDDLTPLLERLPHAALPATLPTPGERSRLRALADRAWQLREDDDLSALLAALQRESGDAVTPAAELHAAAAHIYFAAGQLQDARTCLEQAAHSLPNEHPRSLAGLVLARLGQVRDAQGERELAQRTYRAVLALNFAPDAARAAAEAGLQEPFTLDLG